MRVTPEHQRALEKNAKPVFVVNQLSFFDVMMAVAIGVAVGLSVTYFIIAVLNVRL